MGDTIKKPVKLYAVGDIVQTFGASPAARFGGTWEQIAQGRTLIGAGALSGNTYTAGQTGGAATHTLTVEQMPYHMHGNIHINGAKLTVWSDSNIGNSAFNMGELFESNGRNNNTFRTGYEGGGQAHNNMQPFLACYIWKCTDDSTVRQFVPA